MSSQLLVEHMTFAPREREAWRRASPAGRRKLYADLRPCYLTEVIARKAMVRPNRFFGEAYVARAFGYEDAWYSSFKWLTASCWADGRRLTHPARQDFKSTLGQHFPTLARVQRLAAAMCAELGITPVAPDLWLLRNGEHWFVEVKIPPDALADSQIAGMALIASQLRGAMPVKVATVYLHQGVAPPRQTGDVQTRFQEFCSAVSGLAKRFPKGRSAFLSSSR